MKPHINRKLAIIEARKLYIKTGVTDNIAVAFRIYLDNHPEVDLPYMISKRDTEYVTPKTIPDRNRPRCPYCDIAMSLWQVNTHPKNMVGGPYKTQWICPNEDGCGYQDEYSELSIEEQIKKYADM